MTRVIDLSAGSGDCWASSTGTFDNTATSISLLDSGGVETRTWLPFVVPLDKNTTVITATLKLTAFATSGTASDTVDFGCEGADNPSAPTSKADLFGRTKTAGASYSIGQYVTDTVYSYDMTSQIQDILNRAGWVKNNTLAVLTEWTGSGPHQKRFYSNEGGGGTKMAILEITVANFLPSSGFIT